MSTTEVEKPVEPRAEGVKKHRRLPDWIAGNLLLLPTSVWFLFLLVIPTLLVVAYSLGQRGVITPIRFSWGHLVFSNYHTALNPRFLPIFWRSIWYSLVATIACVLLGFPVAFQHSGEMKAPAAFGIYQIQKNGAFKRID